MDVALQFLEARRLAAPPGNDIWASPSPFALRSSRQPWAAAIGSPLAIGLLMLVAPPVAVTLVWAAPSFDRTARVALSLFGALVTALMAAIVVIVAL